MLRLSERPGQARTAFRRRRPASYDVQTGRPLAASRHLQDDLADMG